MNKMILLALVAVSLAAFGCKEEEAAAQPAAESAPAATTPAAK
jgi:hypothetical protein